MAKHVNRPIERIRSVHVFLNGREITEEEQATVDLTNPTVTHIVEDALTLHFERLERQLARKAKSQKRTAS